MRSVLLVAAASVLAACGATMLNSPAGNSKYAPVNDANRSGEVAYLNEGANFVRTKRRENAYKQMYESCGGAYRIDAEGDRVGSTVTWATTSVHTDASAQAAGSMKTTSGIDSARTAATGAAQGEATTTATTASGTAVGPHYWVMRFTCVHGDSAAAAGVTPVRQ